LSVVPYSTHADEGWVIDSFFSEINVESTGVVNVQESIDVDFGGLSKHGIYRDIPYEYEGDIFSEIEVEGVMRDGVSEKFSESEHGGYLRLKIGDANRTISGKHEYVIRYGVKGVLRGFEGYDELYWNVTGNGWPVTIRNARAVVTLPMEGMLKARCFEGFSGSDEVCHSIVGQASGTFKADRDLREGEGLTVVVGFEKGMVPILVVNRPESFWEKLVSWPSVTTLFSVVGIGAATVFWLWYRFGRDFWFGTNLFGKSGEKGAVKPIGSRETTVVEFEPPEKLSPAEMGVVVDETANTSDVTAMIIDLATRGFIKIEEVPKKWIFGKNDYILKKTERSHAGLEGFERKILSELFKSGDEVSVSALKTTFYKALKEVKNDLYKSVVKKGFFPSSPDTVRIKYLIIGITVGVVGFAMAFFGIDSENVVLADLGIGIGTSSAILIFVSKFMPRKTAHGRNVYRRILGYRMFIERSEKYRQRYFEKENMFNEVLPYAIVFGLTKKFADAMKEIGLKPAEPSWYTGVNAFNAYNFADSMDGFSSSMSRAIAAAPKSSGFSGGGGYSGGGFGGGGGGSW